jgi:hypothetical protein
MELFVKAGPDGTSVGKAFKFTFSHIQLYIHMENFKPLFFHKFYKMLRGKNCNFSVYIFASENQDKRSLLQNTRINIFFYF